MESLITAYPKARPTFYRSANGVEIDLILERKGKRVGFEFKLSEGVYLPRHLKTTVRELGIEHLYVVTQSSDAIPISERISWTGLVEACDAKGVTTGLA